VPPLEPQEIERLSKALPEWSLAPDGKSIHRKWRVKDFLAAMDFFQQIAHVAEADDHHPDLHLTGYRNVMVELSTHAIGGLSENDFILAAKIDALPVELKAPAS
jgi:4a-hydroxytetrahydrobiopterin dehydratase